MRPLTRLQPLRPILHNHLHAARRRALVTQTPTRSLHIPRPWRRPEAPPHEGEVETFKVSSRAWSWRKIALIGAQAGGAYFLFQYFTANLADKLGITQEELDAADAEAGDEEDEESFFIALSYPQKLPQTFYKSSDPEWLDFVKMSQDEARKDALREELAQKVTETVAAHPRMRMQLGDSIQCSNYWLELKFPDSPPSDYARKVLEFGSEYIAIGTQVIPHDQYAEINHVLVQVPTAVFRATKNSFRIFFRLQYIKVKAALGISLSQWDKQVQAVSAMEQMRAVAVKKQMEQEGVNGESKKSSGNPLTELHEKMMKRFAITLDPRSLQQPCSGRGASDTTSSSDKAGSKGSSASTDTSNQSSTSTSSSTVSSPPTASSVLSSLPTPPPQPSLISAAGYATDISLAFRMFLTTLMQSLVHAKHETDPRGSFLVVGQVEVRGDRGRAKCDVKAAYDPKQAKYLYVKTAVKHFWELEQAAKGGP